MAEPAPFPGPLAEWPVWQVTRADSWRVVVAGQPQLAAIERANALNKAWTMRHGDGVWSDREAPELHLVQLPRAYWPWRTAPIKTGVPMPGPKPDLGARVIAHLNGLPAGATPNRIDCCQALGEAVERSYWKILVAQWREGDAP